MQDGLTQFPSRAIALYARPLHWIPSSSGTLKPARMDVDVKKIYSMTEVVLVHRLIKT